MHGLEENEVKASWAEQVELGDEGVGYSSDALLLPAPFEEFDEESGIRKLIEYKFNEDGKKVKIVKTYKIETRKVSQSAAKRKTLKKFGAASGDPPGPNPSNTVISEDIFMQFVHAKDLQENDEDPLGKLKNQKMVSCRICKGDHWTTKCPYKDSLGVQANAEAQEGDKKKEEPAASSGPQAAAGGRQLGKYVPPSLREGGNRKGESMSAMRARDEAATIRVTNLSEDTRETDLQDLFRPFGSISRIFLAKDKVTGQSKGFAFINFYRREDAARAIAGVSGFGYDHLILNVEWAKPSAN